MDLDKMLGDNAELFSWDRMWGPTNETYISDDRLSGRALKIIITTMPTYGVEVGINNYINQLCKLVSASQNELKARLRGQGQMNFLSSDALRPHGCPVEQNS